MTEQSHAVFLSYASQDAEAVQKICKALHAAGVEVWFDQSELRGGDAWDQSIRKQIKTCALFIPVISRHTHDRAEGYFRLEWKLAVDRSHLIMANKAFLLPVVIDDARDDDENVPDKFREVQWTRLPGGEAPPEFVARIRRLLSPEPPTTARSPPNAAQGSSPIPATTSRPSLWRRAVSVVIGVLVLAAVAYLLTDKPWISKPAGTSATSNATSSPAAPSAAFNPPQHSIAVLPFADMSEKKNQEYFSDGLAEELLDLLSQVPDLRVPARTSSFYFKGKQATIAEIAKALGVTHVLEGSVRKAGNTVRVTVQLIRADSGYHLWSKTYDRTLDDIFKVQDDIAGQVVKSLKISLGANEVPRAVTTNNPEAHAMLLQGEYLFDRETPDDLTKAIDYFQQATRLDPDSALAWADLSLALTTAWQNGWLPNRTFQQLRAQAFQAADRAIALNPRLGPAHEALAEARYWFDWDWAGVDSALEKARTLDPSATWIAGSLAVQRGHLNEAKQLYEAASERDPLNADAYTYLAEIYYAMHEFPEALAVARKAVELGTGGSRSHATLAKMLLAMGQPDAALAEAERETDPGYRAYALARTYILIGRRPDADAALAAMEKTFAADWAYEIAGLHALRNEPDQAFAWLDRAYHQRDTALIGTPSIEIDMDMKNLHADPRWKEFVHKLKLPE